MYRRHTLSTNRACCCASLARPRLLNLLPECGLRGCRLHAGVERHITGTANGYDAHGQVPCSQPASGSRGQLPTSSPQAVGPATQKMFTVVDGAQREMHKRAQARANVRTLSNRACSNSARALLCNTAPLPPACVCFRQRDMARHAIYHGARGADTPALANLVRPPELTRCTHNLAVEPQALSVRRPRQDCRCPAGPYVATLTAQRRTAKRLPLLRSRSTADVLRSRSSAYDTRSTYRKRERTYCSRARGAASSRWLPVVVCRANSPCVVARVQRTVRRRRRAR